MKQPSAFLLTLLSGLAAGVGMLVAPLWFCAPLGLGVWIATLWERTHSRKQALLLGALFGTVTSGAGILSLLEIIPPTESPSLLPTLLATFLLWIIPTVALGITSAPVGIALYLTRRNLFAPLIAVALWVLNEELRMWAWMLITYGTGAIPEPHLSIAALGYALADNAYLLQLAEGGGLLFLTIATAVFAATIASAVQDGARLRLTFMVLATLVLLCIPLTQQPLQFGGETVRIALVATQTDPLAPSVFSSPKLSGPAPDVLILPEGKSLEAVLPQELLSRTASGSWLSASNDLLVIRSGESVDPTGKRHNTVFYESAAEGVLATQNKHFIMPQGEYMPHLSKLFLSWLPDSALMRIPDEKAIVHGETLISVPFQGVTFGTLLCSELFSPHLYRKLSEHYDATVLVSLADPIWFQSSPILFRKTVQVAKVHAVQNRAYFLAAQNATPSFVIDPTGSLVAQSAWYQNDVLFFDLPKQLP